MRQYSRIFQRGWASIRLRSPPSVTQL